MTVITQSIEIDAPASKVERHYTNWGAYPDYIPFIAKVTETTPNVLDVSLRVAGIPFHYVADVAQNGPHSWSWKTREGTIHHSGTATIEPLGENRTRLTLEVNYQLPGPDVIGKIGNWLGLADSGLRSSLENFRARVEMAND